MSRQPHVAILRSIVVRLEDLSLGEKVQPFQRHHLSNGETINFLTADIYKRWRLVQRCKRTSLMPRAQHERIKRSFAVCNRRTHLYEYVVTPIPSHQDIEHFACNRLQEMATLASSRQEKIWLERPLWFRLKKFTKHRRLYPHQQLAPFNTSFSKISVSLP